MLRSGNVPLHSLKDLDIRVLLAGRHQIGIGQVQSGLVVMWPAVIRDGAPVQAVADGIGDLSFDLVLAVVTILRVYVVVAGQPDAARIGFWTHEGGGRPSNGAGAKR